MKLTVEITENDFTYNYSIGNERQSSTSPIGADFIVLFADLLKACALTSRLERERRSEELIRQAHIRDFVKDRKDQDEVV